MVSFLIIYFFAVLWEGFFCFLFLVGWLVNWLLLLPG